MKFAVIALIGVVSATSLKAAYPCGCNKCEPVCNACDTCGCDGYDGYSRSGYGCRGGVDATLPGAERSGAYAKLTAESAGSQTQIGAQQISIPDKCTVTDQAKVSEAQSKGSAQSQKCTVAKRTFDICGSISVEESYNDQSKSQHCAEKDGEGASQSRSRTQVQNNLCARADIPCTCAAGGCGCGCKSKCNIC
jgi:hypothetical protein